MWGFRIAPVLACLLVSASPVAARLPADAPPLPPPDPDVYSIVHVETAQQLADACWNLTSDQAIVIAPGVYHLGQVNFPSGVDGRLTVGRFGDPPISNIQIRGATGDPRDVVLLGEGMLDPIVPNGFQIFTATDVTIADLSVGEVYFHAIMISGDQGARDVRLYNLRLFDAGQQIVKGSTDGADDVVIEYSDIFYTLGAIEHPEGAPPGSCYTNGIDATGGDDWIIRDNLIRGIKCQNGAMAGPAILMWMGSVGTLVERNTLLDSSRGIYLGLVGPADHTAGIARNNFLRWDPEATYVVDVPIYTTSPGSQILHNTAITHGHYPNAIEVRYAGATGVSVVGNLVDALITARDGATPTVENNETDAQLEWFQDEASGDLHLTPAATAAIDQADPHPLVADDFDGFARPGFPGEIDLGGSELESNAGIFSDGFESGDTGAWSTTVP